MPGERQQEPEGQAAVFCVYEASHFQSTFKPRNTSEPLKPAYKVPGAAQRCPFDSCAPEARSVRLPVS